MTASQPVHDTPKQPRVAFQGERGAYSEQALLTYFPHADAVPCRVIGDAFDAVTSGDAAYGAIPVENSQAGSINEAYDLLLRHDLTVVGEVKFRVSHCLLALPGQTLGDIKKVYSHPQALAQSMEYLRTLGAEIIAGYDTAGSAKMVAEERLPGVAAVAGRLAGELYGLTALAAAIETNPNNYTRFLIVTKDAGHWRDVAPNKTSIVFAVLNQPGALYRALGCLAWRGINMTKLESRPSRDKPFEYVFYVDFDGDVANEPYKSAMDELRSQTAFLRVLGSYLGDEIEIRS